MVVAERLVVAVQVNREVVNVDADVLRSQVLERGLTQCCSVLADDPHRVQMPRAAPVVRLDEGPQTLDLGKGQRICVRKITPGSNPCVELRHLGGTEGTVDVRQPVVEPELCDVVRPRSEFASLPEVGVDAMVAETAHPAGELGVVGHHHAALSRREVLDGVEAEGGHVCDAADAAAAVHRSRRMARILDEQEAVPVGDRQQLVQIARDAGVVDGDDGLRSIGVTSDSTWAGSIPSVSSRTSANTHVGAHVAHAVGARGKRHCGDDHFVARSDPGGQHGEMQRRSSVGYGNTMLGAHVLGKGMFEGVDRRTGRQPIPAEDLGDRSDVVLVDDLPTVGDELSGHPSSVAIRWRSSSTVRKWLLVSLS